MKKQTAVDWLIKEINKMIDFIPMDKWDKIRDIVQQAKEIEKEQIIYSHISGMQFIAVDLNHYYNDSEQYFNETFKKL